MIITPNTANVLALCYFGVDPSEGVTGHKWPGRKTTIAHYINYGAIEPDGRTLTAKGLAILEEHARSNP
jgi:hypothetical protein